MQVEKDTVCAVVVTYNRKNLLVECLEALGTQTRTIQGIYLIDNASTDGTPELLLEKGYIAELPSKDLLEPWEKEFQIKNLTDGNVIKFYYVRMHENTGGAGGFHEGVKRAYKKGYDWLWLMDDDTISTSTSLAIMMSKLKTINNVGFACSKVIWNDGKPHIMNIPSIKQLYRGRIPFNLYENEGVLIVETASFVSLLVNIYVVEQVGLPIKDFFVWSDDVEYTLRITKSGFLGLYVKDSIVCHKTRSNYSANQVYDWRFYYKIRNNLWINRMYNRGKFFFLLIKHLVNTFRLPRRVRYMNLKALADSIIKKPTIVNVKG